MYQITTKDKTILAERIEFVMRQDNGIIVSCNESESMGIVSDTNDGFYQLEGREYLGDYEVASVQKISVEDDIFRATVLLKQAEIINKQNEQDAVSAAILLKQAQGGI